MSIDVHNHFYPEAYLKALQTGRYTAGLDVSSGSDPILHYAGDYNILVPGHRDLDARIEDMQKVGMESQILSLTTPGVHIEEPAAGIELARAVNEDFAEICGRHKQFFAFAALPLQSPEKAAEELRYAVGQLGLHGGVLFTNVQGRALDHQAFSPIFSTAEQLGAPLFIHPTSPDDHGALADFRLVPLLGFLFDTTATIARLVFAGVLQRHPRLKLIAAHLGGTLPYVAERMDRGYRVYPEISDMIPQPPSHYLSGLYLDTVNFDPDALRFALQWSDETRLLLGSDYPHQIGDMKKALQVIEEMDLLPGQKISILRENAVQMLDGIGRQ